MIFKSIITLLTSIFDTLLGFFPAVDTTITAGIHDSLYNVKAYVYQFNWIFPADTFFQCLTIILAFYVLIGVFRLVKFIASIFSFGIIK
jgi:hypothetical protein